MENILNDSQKIGLYAQIQKELNDLNPNCSDEELCHVIDLIPESYLNQKDELMMICQLFAYYPRNSPKYVRKNAINLFDKLIDPIKSSLQGESSFFWNIFGGLYYFKHIMYDNDLISIDTIVRESLYDRTGAVSEYFYPELFEYKPELFEKELQRKVKKQLSKSEIEEFKDLRKKHIKWLRESNDYNDEIYREIEKNRLRLSIKTDDIDTFQSILSNSNMSIDSQIIESVIENSYFQPAQVSLIEYAIEFNSIKIFKYLLMNDAKIEIESIFNSIRNRNYEIIHLVESKILEKFKEFSLIDSLSCWNYELAIYSMDNYDFTLDEDAEITTEKEEKIFEIIKEICYSLNFQFLESIFLPFLKKNPDFVQKNINEIIINTFFDQSAYFTKEFMKCQGININYHSRLNEKQSLLCEALRRKNKKAAELLLKNPKIDIINPCCESFSPFQFACGSYSDLSIFSLFFKNPNFDIYWRDSLYDLTALDYCILCGNFLAIEVILTNFPDYNENIRSDLLYHCFNHNYLMTLKLILKHLEKSNVNKILESTRNNKKYSIVLHQIVQEINDDT